MLVSAERNEETENARPTATVIPQVKGEFKARGFAVSLAKSTVNRYIQNVDMVGSAPLASGYEGIIPKAIFKLLVLAVESFIKIKQVNCEVIVQKQLLVAVNKLCGIASGDRIKENMLERVLRLTTVSLDVTITPAVKERMLLWTTRDNLHTWFLGFKEFLLKFGLATLNDNTRELIFSPKMLRPIINVDETKASLDGSNMQVGGRPAMSYRDPHLPQIMKSVAKSSFECTAIFGSSPAGELVPVHF